MATENETERSYRLVMPLETAQAVRDRVCTDKAVMGRRDARALAARCNMGQPVGAAPYNSYRCPFGGGRHWHVAHVISRADMGLVARAIRALAQGAA